MTLNPLANPKGVNLVCELCQKPAFIVCSRCRVTYYCGLEHQKADWLGIHEKICDDLKVLRQPAPFLASNEERMKREVEMMTKKKALIDLTRTTAQKLLFEGKHEQSVPAAMQSLRFAMDVHGIASIELVPSYLILGEASIGLGRLSQAEDYLSQGQWTVVKTPDCSNAIKSKLFRNLGLLYAAKGQYDEALRQLADDIYHASEDFGPDDIRTSGGYFHMANVFFRQGKMDISDSLYRQVANIWFTHLEKLVRIRTAVPDTPKGVGPGIVQTVSNNIDSLDEAQEAEAIQVLNAIFDMREQRNHPEDLATVSIALAMLYFILNDVNKAKEFGRKALVACEGSKNDNLARTIVDFMKKTERLN